MAILTIIEASNLIFLHYPHPRAKRTKKLLEAARRRGKKMMYAPCIHSKNCSLLFLSLHFFHYFSLVHVQCGLLAVLTRFVQFALGRRWPRIDKVQFNMQNEWKKEEE